MNKYPEHTIFECIDVNNFVYSIYEIIYVDTLFREYHVKHIEYKAGSFSWREAHSNEIIKISAEKMDKMMNSGHYINHGVKDEI